MAPPDPAATVDPAGPSLIAADAGPDGESSRDGDGTAPAETKGERTRRRLLEIAIDRFGERGYRATSVSEIARTAGLTQAAVYAYFSSKEALFDAAVDADAAAAISRTTSQVAEVPAIQLVPMMLVFLLGGVEEHPLLKRVLQGHEPEALQRLVNLPSLTDLADLIAGRIREAQARGEVRADIDPELFSHGAEAIIVSLMLSVTQVGQTTEARRQLGVLTIFDSVLRPVAQNR